jgi:AraC family transcriptional regulator
MQPRIQNLPEKKLVGKRITLSLAHNKTAELWSNFMPRRNELIHAMNTSLYSVGVYPPLYFTRFNPQTEFEKWAAIEVSSFDQVPADMETLTIPAGQYAVFVHRGPVSLAPQTFRYIFETWLPGSAFILADRPHMEIMGKQYHPESADSEEEFWIPVLPK